MSARRLKRFQVSGECIANLLRVGGTKFIVSESDCPKDASFMSSHYDIVRNCFWCVMEHYSFELVPEGSVIPESWNCVVITESE